MSRYDDLRSLLAGAGVECVLWPYARDWDDYGMVRIAGRQRRAHRVAWELANGATVPDGLVVRHRCDHPPCVNPAHLEIGTVAENNADRERRGRSSDRRGELCPTAKLSWADVGEIREHLLAGRSHSSLAQAFGVSRKAISKIANGQTWQSERAS